MFISKLLSKTTLAVLTGAALIGGITAFLFMPLPAFAPKGGNGSSGGGGGGPKITLAKLADMNYGLIDFTATASGDITMGSNGNITYGPGYSGTGQGTAGQIEIQTDTGTLVDIACANDARIKYSNKSIKVENIEFVVGTSNVTSYGNGTACDKINKVSASHTVSSNSSNNIIYVGAALETGNGVSLSGLYTATNANKLMEFRVVVQ